MNAGKHQNRTNKRMEPDSGEAARQAESILMPEARKAVTGPRVKVGLKGST